MLIGLKDPDIAKDLESRVQYTEDQLAAIYRVSHVTIFGFPVKLDDHTWISTVEGLQRQIDAFKAQSGFVYFATFKSGKFDLDKMAVYKSPAVDG